jgi:hypothetical protein
MNYPIVESSPIIKAKIKSFNDKVGVDANMHALQKYPFKMLHIGESFVIKHGDVNERNIRLMATSYGNTYGKKFTVKKWNEYQLFEIGRIA